MSSAASETAETACSVSAWTFSNSSSTWPAVARTSASGAVTAPRSSSASQWYRSAARVQAEISASNTRADGDISSTIRVTDRHSEMPRTSSAFPTRSSGPVPTGCAAA